MTGDEIGAIVCVGLAVGFLVVYYLTKDKED